MWGVKEFQRAPGQARQSCHTRGLTQIILWGREFGTPFTAQGSWHFVETIIVKPVTLWLVDLSPLGGTLDNDHPGDREKTIVQTAVAPATYPSQYTSQFRDERSPHCT